MNKKTVRLAFLLIVVTMIITGCSSSLRSENDKLKKAIAVVKNSNTNLERKVK